jgi:hypothetical protein
MSLSWAHRTSRCWVDVDDTPLRRRSLSLSLSTMRLASESGRDRELLHSCSRDGSAAMDDRTYLTAEKVSERNSGAVSVGTFRNWLALRVGPSFVKIGKAILYAVRSSPPSATALTAARRSRTRSSRIWPAGRSIRRSANARCRDAFSAACAPRVVRVWAPEAAACWSPACPRRGDRRCPGRDRRMTGLRRAQAKPTRWPQRAYLCTSRSAEIGRYGAAGAYPSRSSGPSKGQDGRSESRGRASRSRSGALIYRHGG